MAPLTEATRAFTSAREEGAGAGTQQPPSSRSRPQLASELELSLVIARGFQSITGDKPSRRLAVRWGGLITELGKRHFLAGSLFLRSTLSLILLVCLPLSLSLFFSFSSFFFLSCPIFSSLFHFSPLLPSLPFSLLLSLSSSFSIPSLAPSPVPSPALAPSPVLLSL